MNMSDDTKGRVLQAAFYATSLFLMIPDAQAVDGYAKDASNGCAIFKPNLKAGETVAFKGACANMFGEGRGVAKWSASDGTTVTFEGNFVQGKLQGNGKMTASGGDRYEGDYKDGKREGLGVYTSANGDQFKGQYKDNQRNGHGILTLATGSLTEGEGRNGNPVSVTSRFSSGAALDRLWLGKWKGGEQRGGSGSVSSLDISPTAIKYRSLVGDEGQYHMATINYKWSSLQDGLRARAVPSGSFLFSSSLQTRSKADVVKEFKSNKVLFADVPGSATARHTENEAIQRMGPGRYPVILLYTNGEINELVLDGDHVWFLPGDGMGTELFNRVPMR